MKNKDTEEVCFCCGSTNYTILNEGGDGHPVVECNNCDEIGNTLSTPTKNQ